MALRLKRSINELIVLAGKVGLVIREELRDDLGCFLEPVHAPTHGLVFESVGGVLVFLPTRTDAEHDTSAGNHIHA